MPTSEKILFGSAAAVIGVFSALGFYLIEGEPVIKSLVITGHNHILSFAYGAILFGLLLKIVNLTEPRKIVLSVWMATTFFGPLALICAGFTGNTSFLPVTSPVFEGSFVVLWLIIFWLLMRRERI
ncbi:MAG: hypothetical protein AAB560_02720 [Patescibacteria group bacterium]